MTFKVAPCYWLKKKSYFHLIHLSSRNSASTHSTQTADPQLRVFKWSKTEPVTFSVGVKRTDLVESITKKLLNKGLYGMSAPRRFSVHATSSRAVTTIASASFFTNCSRISPSLSCQLRPAIRFMFIWNGNDCVTSSLGL